DARSLLRLQLRPARAIRQRHKIKILRLRLIIGFILFFRPVLFFLLPAFLLDPQRKTGDVYRFRAFTSFSSVSVRL
ncbi:MAG: hypothetical protein ACYTAO_15145, partial [Planctomycetota bacterium]